MPIFKLRVLPDCEICGSNEWLEEEISSRGIFICQQCGCREDFREVEVWDKE